MQKRNATFFSGTNTIDDDHFAWTGLKTSMASARFISYFSNSFGVGPACLLRIGMRKMVAYSSSWVLLVSLTIFIEPRFPFNMLSNCAIELMNLSLYTVKSFCKVNYSRQLVFEFFSDCFRAPRRSTCSLQRSFCSYQAALPEGFKWNFLHCIGIGRSSGHMGGSSSSAWMRQLGALDA